MKIDIKRNTKAFNEFAVKMTLTEGAILTLKESLQRYASAGSPIAEDLNGFMERAMKESGIKP